MGESPLPRRVLLGAPPASARPRNISQAYARRAESGFPVFGLLQMAGKRLLALSGRRRAARPARKSGFRELEAALSRPFEPNSLLYTLRRAA
jgi:hypothetical protein